MTHSNDESDDDARVHAFAGMLRDDSPDEVDVAALVRVAIERSDEELVEGAAQLLREDIPVELGHEEERGLAKRALGDPSGKRASNVIPIGRPADTSWTWAAAAAAVLVVGVGAYTLLGPSDSAHDTVAEGTVAEGTVAEGTVAEGTVAGGEHEAAPTERVLAGGHRVLMTTATELEETEPGHIALRSGEALFVVEPLDDDAQFVVRANGVTVRVTGTVFIVRQEAERTEVAVYEGSVEVVSGHERRSLEAGDRYASDGAPRAIESAFDARARREATRRLEGALAANRESPAVAVASMDDVEAPAERLTSPTTRRPRRSAPADPQALRSMIAGQHYDAALMEIDSALRREPRRLDLLLLRADALRGLRRSAEALGAYRRALAVARGERRAEVGLAMARHLALTMNNPTAAREVLRSSGALHEGSAVRPGAQRLLERLNE